MADQIKTHDTVSRTRARFIGDLSVEFGIVLAVVGADAVVSWSPGGRQETVRIADLDIPRWA